MALDVAECERTIGYLNRMIDVMGCLLQAYTVEFDNCSKAIPTCQLREDTSDQS